MKRFSITINSIFIALLFLSSSNLSAQGRVGEILSEKMSARQATNVALVRNATEGLIASKYANIIDPKLLSTSEFYDVNVNSISSLKTNNTDLMTMPITLPGYGNVTLGLYHHNIFTEDLIIQSNEGVQSNKAAKKILFYRGAVLGYSESVVSVTIFEDEISGVISIDSDNFNLGKIKGVSTHILYNDKVLDDPTTFVCGTVDSEISKPKPLETFSADKTVQCVRMRVEVDNAIASQLGGMTGSVNYVAGLYNEVLTLFANDNIGANVSEVFVWLGSSPYSGSSSQMLDQMSNTSPNADITTLLSNQGNGGLAWLDALCFGSNFEVNVCNIDGFYSNVPTFSWDVMVVTHEAGHNFGSEHTHACAWNGNGTAIDGCGPDAGYSEGCSGSLPAAGGTIMSYCHLTSVGINLNLGFGEQPGQRIRDFIDAAGCLGTVCEPVAATCTDGIQNGDETGIDCGGPDCEVCPTCNDGIQNGDEEDVDCGGSFCEVCPCYDVPASITITFDDYPEETSWSLSNTLGDVIATGDSYGSEQDGSTLNIPLCLEEGCYNFTIFDSYGDGMCCAYGEGSYSVTDGDNNVLASGGSYSSEETTSFCVVDQMEGTALALKVFLEGAFDPTSELMNDGLRISGEIPLDEPYSAMGYDVPLASTNIVLLGQTGADAIVDWVLVELRNPAIPSELIASQAALVQRDGDIVSVDGSSLAFENVSQANVIVAVRHRNHFGVRTSSSFPIDALVNVDFTDPTSPIFGIDPMTLLGNGSYGLISGDANSDGQVNGVDKNVYWRVQSGVAFDYLTFRSDFNLDGTVNSVDKNVHWRNNNSKSEQLE